eukprot:gene8947-12064_t
MNIMQPTQIDGLNLEDEQQVYDSYQPTYSLFKTIRTAENKSDPYSRRRNNTIKSVSSIEYDYYTDMLWSGTEDGRVTAYSITNLDGIEDSFDENDEEIYDQTKPFMKKYSSFMASNDCIVKLLPNQNCFVSASLNSLQLHSYGGLLLGKIKYNFDYLSDNSPIGSAYCTCADLIRSPMYNRISPAFMGTHVMIGTNSEKSFLYDISINHTEPIMEYDVKLPSCSIQSNGHQIAVAGMDGNIRLLDGKLRSHRIINTMEAHSGAIQDMFMESDGRIIATCGLSKRAINPYDLNTPYNFVSDPIVRIFDLRMQKQITPLPIITSIANGSVRFVRFIPNSISDDGSTSSTSVLITTDDGLIHTTVLDSHYNSSTSNGVLSPPPTDMSKVETFYGPQDMENANDYISCVSIAPSGQFIAVGTSTGAIGNYASTYTPAYSVNENSPCPRTHPKVFPPKPLMSLPPDAIVLGTSYIICPNKNHPQDPLTLSGISRQIPIPSSFETTPKLAYTKLKLTSARKLNNEIKLKAVKQDFIGIVPNPGFTANSMLFGALNKKAYAICDPRKISEITPDSLLASSSQSSNNLSIQPINISRSSNNLNKYNNSINNNYSNNNNNNIIIINNTNQNDNNNQNNPVSYSNNIIQIPKHYELTKSNRNKQQRILNFNYNIFNNTDFIGLENNFPSHYSNPLLQLLYSLPFIKNYALQSQLSSYQHVNNNTIWCELGFLFHMILLLEERVKNGNKIIPKFVRPVNFQNNFHLIPEAVTLGLGLFEDSNNSNNNNVNYYHTKIQTLCRFLLSHLQREIQLELKAQNATPTITTSKTKSFFSNNKSEINNNNNNANNDNNNNNNPIEDLFGYSLQSSTTFLQSNITEMATSAIQFFTTELIYTPSTTATTATTKSISNNNSSECNNNSFASVLWNSFQKETYM